jgi:hypothetical protein
VEQLFRSIAYVDDSDNIVIGIDFGPMQPKYSFDPNASIPDQDVSFLDNSVFAKQASVPRPGDSSAWTSANLTPPPPP